MKPELSTHVEYVNPTSPEAPNIRHSDLHPRESEKLPVGSYERGGKESIQGVMADDVSLTSVLPQPVNTDEPVVNDTTMTNFPMVANDDDLIEKEWVDKAKKIISETKDNPYGQEKAVGQLQIDYLKKRYGREIGASSE